MPQLARAHEQVADHYRKEIREGHLAPDDRLDPVRAIAEAWSVSTHTVWLAMGVLKAEGWIDVRQGRRPVVVGVPEAQ
jgi:GntR family transcriptional regulator